MKKALKVILPLVLIVVIIASIGWYLFVYDRDFTRDMLLAQARHYNDSGNPEMASWFYGLAYNYTDQDENIAIELANQYKSDGNYTKAEFTLTNAISNGGTAELYIALCRTYVEQDKLLDAVNMLNNIADPAIRSELSALRPSAPEVSVVPGFYSEYVDLELLCGSGKLYYTLSEEYPSTGDDPFRDPITLPVGVTTIQAVVVDDNGLVSPLAVFEYTVGGIVEEVVFTDAAMEQAVRAVLQVDEDDVIMTNTLWGITEFTVPAEAGSVEDLRFLSYLQQLTMQEQKLANLDVLAELVHLQAVDLSGCRFPAESLRVLAQLPELKRVSLNDCALSTVAELAGATKLTHLYLSNNTLRNLTALSGMTNLVELTLDHNAVIELSYLGGMTRLEKLDVSHNSLTSLAPLASCTKLNWLDVGNNTLAELDTVDQLTQLKHLDLDYNQLTDISILASCLTLTELNISRNQIADLSPLSGINTLEVLDFSNNLVKELPKWTKECALRNINGSNNEIKKLDSLADLPNLSYVYMDYNKITSVDALADCYHLVLVNVYGNEIKDVSKLTDRDILVNYDPT